MAPEGGYGTLSNEDLEVLRDDSVPNDQAFEKEAQAAQDKFARKYLNVESLRSSQSLLATSAVDMADFIKDIYGAAWKNCAKIDRLIPAYTPNKETIKRAMELQEEGKKDEAAKLWAEAMQVNPVAIAINLLGDLARLALKLIVNVLDAVKGGLKMLATGLKKAALAFWDGTKRFGNLLRVRGQELDAARERNRLYTKWRADSGIEAAAKAIPVKDRSKFIQDSYKAVEEQSKAKDARLAYRQKKIALQEIDRRARWKIPLSEDDSQGVATGYSETLKEVKTMMKSKSGMTERNAALAILADMEKQRTEEKKVEATQRQEAKNALKRKGKPKEPEREL